MSRPNPVWKVVSQVGLVSLVSGVVSYGAIAMNIGSERATTVNRLTALEQIAEANKSDHDLLTKIANDVEWIKRSLEKQDKASK